MENLYNVTGRESRSPRKIISASATLCTISRRWEVGE